MRRVLLAGSLLALALPGQAFAHATLERTFPGFQQRLQTSPPTVQLHFDQYIQALPRSLQLFSASGPLSLTRTRDEGRTLEAKLPHLRKGGYTIRWHAMSGDGHVVSGVFTFGVRARAPAPTAALISNGAIVLKAHRNDA